LDKTSELGEVGAAVIIPPNMARILRDWGLDLEHDARVSHIGGVRRWNAEGKLFAENAHNVASGMYMVRALRTFHFAIAADDMRL
jgi:hypothetical protein